MFFNPIGIIQKHPPDVFCKKSCSQKLKKRLWHTCLPVNFAKFLRIPFLQNISRRLLLMIDFFQVILLITAQSKDEQFKEHFHICMFYFSFASIYKKAFLTLTSWCCYSLNDSVNSNITSCKLLFAVHQPLCLAYFQESCRIKTGSISNQKAYLIRAKLI